MLRPASAIRRVPPRIHLANEPVNDLNSARQSERYGFELTVAGQPTRMLKPGDGFQIPPNTPHAGGKPGDAKTRVLITYVVEKDKPLASPA